MYFFERFPKAQYRVSNSDKPVTATDVTKRFRVIEDVLKNKFVLYTYQVKDGETARMIANKFYKDITLDWLIYLTNKIQDPLMDWPMSHRELEQVIVKKYGSLESAKTTVYEYYKILQPREIMIDGTIVEERKLVIDQPAYLLLADFERSTITQYHWEQQENEAKRTIKLIDTSFVPSILAEFKTLFD